MAGGSKRCSIFSIGRRGRDPFRNLSNGCCAALLSICPHLHRIYARGVHGQRIPGIDRVTDFFPALPLKKPGRPNWMLMLVQGERMGEGVRSRISLSLLRRSPCPRPLSPMQLNALTTIPRPKCHFLALENRHFWQKWLFSSVKKMALRTPKSQNGLQKPRKTPPKMVELTFDSCVYHFWVCF